MVRIKHTLIIWFIVIGIFYIYKISFYWVNNELGKSNTCRKINISNKNIEWSSMSPMYNNWDKIDLMIDYYNNCNKKVVKWDIIAYNYWWNKLALIKIVKVTFKDKVIIQNNNLIVNWNILVNSIWNKYMFSEKELNMFRLYIKDGKIPDDSYFIFWDNVANSIDSRKFWAVSKQDFLWKFIQKK